MTGVVSDHIQYVREVLRGRSPGQLVAIYFRQGNPRLQDFHREIQFGPYVHDSEIFQNFLDCPMHRQLTALNFFSTWRSPFDHRNPKVEEATREDIPEAEAKDQV